MAIEQMERIKRDYTDKYVMVVNGPPELARFAGVVGQVKTVNMSGRALVEWVDYHENIGWYDIDLDFLKLVAKPVVEEVAPLRKTAQKPVAKKPAAAKKGGGLSPLEMLRQQKGTRSTAKPHAAEKDAEDASTEQSPEKK